MGTGKRREDKTREKVKVKVYTKERESRLIRRGTSERKM